MTEESRNGLLKSLKDLIPEGWEIIAHHMTIEFGATSHPEEGNAGALFPIAFSCDDKVCAVKLKKVGVAADSKNETPHITIAVNRKEGGKPFMSNSLKGWVDLPAKPLLFGYYEICD